MMDLPMPDLINAAEDLILILNDTWVADDSPEATRYAARVRNLLGQLRSVQDHRYCLEAVSVALENAWSFAKSPVLV
jgi:hypothetical protein